MSWQLAEFYRQGVVRPIDAEARGELEALYLGDSRRCEFIPIPSGRFSEIWESGILQAVGNACALKITDYEEAVLRAEMVSKARHAVEEAIASGVKPPVKGFAEALVGMLRDAERTNMPIVFVL